MKNYKLLITCLVLFIFAGCTDNQRARSFGGNATIHIEKDQKLVNITWKEADMWILTRTRKEGEKPETYFFKESSNFGMMEGQVTVVEK